MTQRSLGTVTGERSYFCHPRFAAITQLEGGNVRFRSANQQIANEIRARCDVFVIVKSEQRIDLHKYELWGMDTPGYVAFDSPYSR